MFFESLKFCEGKAKSFCAIILPRQLQPSKCFSILSGISTHHRLLWVVTKHGKRLHRNEKWVGEGLWLTLADLKKIVRKIRKLVLELRQLQQGESRNPRDGPQQEQSTQVPSTEMKEFQSYFKLTSLAQVSKSQKRALDSSCACSLDTPGPTGKCSGPLRIDLRPLLLESVLTPLGTLSVRFSKRRWRWERGGGGGGFLLHCPCCFSKQWVWREGRISRQVIFHLQSIKCLPCPT